MATPSSILAFITQAVSLALTDAQMVAVLDYCIATQLTDDGRVVVSTGANGFQTTMSLDQARALRSYYREEVRKSQPPGTLAPEFGFDGSFPSSNY